MARRKRRYKRKRKARGTGIVREGGAGRRVYAKFSKKLSKIM